MPRPPSVYQGAVPPESNPGFVMTLVGSAAAVVVVVGSAVDVASVVGSALEVVIRIVEVAESEVASAVEPEAVSVSDTAVDLVKKVVDVSVSSAIVDDETTAIDVDSVKNAVDVSVSSAMVEDETMAEDEASAEVVDKATEVDEETGLHGDAQTSWHAASS